MQKPASGPCVSPSNRQSQSRRTYCGNGMFMHFDRHINRASFSDRIPFSGNRLHGLHGSERAHRHRCSSASTMTGSPVLESFWERAGLTKPTEVKTAVPSERRKRLRANLHWTVRLYDRSNRWVSGKTRNVSSDGFFCVCAEPFAPGEHLDCAMLIPTQSPSTREQVLCLECRVEVVRVETADEGFGLGCRIKDYRIGDLVPAVDSE